MTIIHHLSVACPLCGETQVIEVQNSDQTVLCGDCGIAGIVNFHGSAESRRMRRRDARFVFAGGEPCSTR